jgi:hypothetical protein
MKIHVYVYYTIEKVKCVTLNSEMKQLRFCAKNNFVLLTRVNIFSLNLKMWEGTKDKGK